MGLALGLGFASILAFTDSARAIETVGLQYQDRSVTVSLDQIREYAETGDASPALQEFIGGNTEIADIVGNLLTSEITITGSFRERVRQDLQSSSFGQFLLLQVDKLFADSQDLSALQDAIQTSLTDNNRLSVIEVLSNYSVSEPVAVNLTEVGVIYNDVKAFVERVLPALEVARDYLQEVICECETTAATEAVESPATPDQPADQPGATESPDSTGEEEMPQSQEQRLPDSTYPAAAATPSNCLTNTTNTANMTAPAAFAQEPAVLK
ncbi:MAG: hypothetical protein Kow00121_40160 [Elainellaceae cyanobacterium]